MQQTLESFRPGKQKYVWFLLMCIVLAIGGGWMLGLQDASPKVRFMGGLCIALFGALAVMAALQLLPNSLRLQVKPDGLAVRTKWWTTDFYRWTDIERFGVAEFTLKWTGDPMTSVIKGHVSGGRHCRRVGFTFSSTYPGGGLAWKFKDYNQSHYGFDGLLPDDYGMDCDKLAVHLNQLREQNGRS